MLPKTIIDSGVDSLFSAQAAPVTGASQMHRYVLLAYFFLPNRDLRVGTTLANVDTLENAWMEMMRHKQQRELNGGVYTFSDYTVTPRHLCAYEVYEGSTLVASDPPFKHDVVTDRHVVLPPIPKPPKPLAPLATSNFK